ncbi:hypothetical protein BC829DRAFT_397479 [Chytridium lagenaria]|nr:hypothetical protein BC829DRAFT_397479 [Chytridium lagenaria]
MHHSITTNLLLTALLIILVLCHHTTGFATLTTNPVNLIPTESCITCLNLLPSSCILKCNLARTCVYHARNCTHCASMRCETLERDDGF